MNRGGVALYLSTDLKCKLNEAMTTAIDDLMEYITVEIEMETVKKMLLRLVRTKRQDQIWKHSKTNWKN